MKSLKRLTVCAALLVAVVATVWPQEAGTPPALLALINTERAFARLSVERGVREAFMTYFAPDGINFTPHPSLTVEEFRKRPAPAKLPPVTLNWAPVYGDIAASGELGYSTGPALITDRSGAQPVERHSLFFSIWKKQPDGQWRVVVDLGIATPRAFTALDAPFQPAPDLRQSAARPARANQDLLLAEKAFFATAQSLGLAKAWDKFLSPDARIYRPDAMPIIGRPALRAWADSQTGTLTQGGEQASWMPQPGWTKTETAQSGEFGYVSGGYEGKHAPGSVERGYYVRVWRYHPGQREWRITMDVTAPLPAK